MMSRLPRMLTLVMLVMAIGAARADKKEKVPVAMGTWTGPHAGSFKSGVRSGVSKECAVVRADKARALIEGEVTENDKKFTVRVVVKSTKTNEIVESREYSFNKPEVSQAQSHRMGRDIAQMAQRAPLEAPPQQ